MSKKAVITGATGLVGSNLAVALLERGHEVVCTRRANSKIEHLGAFPIEWVNADLGEPEALAKAFQGADVVFHCAALVQMLKTVTSDMQKTNIDGTRNVIDAFRQAQAGRLIHCSSVAGIGLAEGGVPADENTVWNFDKYGMADGYNTSKHISQELVLTAAQADVDAVVVNPTYMFGPYDPKPSSGALILSVIKGKIPGVTTGINNYVDVRNVCQGMISAWEIGRRGEKYILGGENMNYEAIMKLIARIAGTKPPHRRIPQAAARLLGHFGDLLELITHQQSIVNTVTVRYGYCQTFMFSSQKAIRELGYDPGSVEKGIADAIAWFKRTGRL